MQPVGDQGRRADLAADPDAVAGDQLVAGEPDDRRRRHQAEGPHLHRVQQAPSRLVAGQGRRGGDEGHDDDPGQILGAAITVGVAAGGGSPAQGEGDGQRDGGERVGQVVQGVAEQGHRAAAPHHHGLQDGGDRQGGEGHGQRPDALATGLELGVDRHGGVVAVRGDQVPEPSEKPRRMVVLGMLGHQGLALPLVGSKCTMAMATFRKPWKAD